MSSSLICTTSPRWTLWIRIRVVGYKPIAEEQSKGVASSLICLCHRSHWENADVMPLTIGRLPILKNQLSGIYLPTSKSLVRSRYRSTMYSIFLFAFADVKSACTYELFLFSGKQEATRSLKGGRSLLWESEVSDSDHRLRVEDFSFNVESNLGQAQ